MPLPTTTKWQSSRSEALRQEGDALGLTQIAAIDEDGAVGGQVILGPDGVSLLVGKRDGFLDLVGVRRHFHALGDYLWIVFQNILHIGRTHAADMVAQGVEPLLLLAEEAVKGAFHPRSAHHAQVDRVLREDVLQQQVGHGLRVGHFEVLYHLGEGDRRSGVEYQVEFHSSKVLLDGMFELTLDQHLCDTLFDGIGLLEVEGAHPEDTDAVHLLQIRLLTCPPFAWRNNVNIMAFVAEPPHEVSIDAMPRNIMQAGHGEEDDFHNGKK